MTNAKTTLTVPIKKYGCFLKMIAKMSVILINELPKMKKNIFCTQIIIKVTAALN